jgi:hypothetical protein
VAIKFDLGRAKGSIEVVVVQCRVDDVMAVLGNRYPARFG